MELKSLGKYEIVAKIGEGGMGEVFRAHDPVLGRDVAIKTMAAKAEGEDLRERFLREARSAARLNHPNIITVHDFGEEQGRMYIAMELLEGTDLRDLVHAGTLDLPTKFGLIEQISDGLAFAHAKEIVHRDLKPGNIHVLANGQVKIMDFGLAKVSSSDMTRAGLILGTPHYMAPEQVQGKKATSGSDVFALGVLFYEMLSGRRPFDGESLQGVLYQVMNNEPDPLEEVAPEVPAELAAIVRKAMSKKPADRYTDAGELRMALRNVRRVLYGGPGPSPASFSSGGALPLPESSTPTPYAVTPRPTLKPQSGPPTAPPPPVNREATVLETRAQTELSRTAVPDATVSPDVPTEMRAPVKTGRRPLPPAEASVASSATSPIFWLLGVAGVGMLVLAGGVVWFVISRVPGGTTPDPVTPIPSPTTAPATPALVSLELLAQNLDAKDYRRVVADANTVLAAEPGNRRAAELKTRAETALGEAETVRDTLRRSLAAGDATAAAQAFSRLVSLDPRDPEVGTFTARLLEVQAEENKRLRRTEAPTKRPVEMAQVPPIKLPPVKPPTAAPPTAAPATPAPATPAPTAAPPVQSEAAALLGVRGVLDQYRASFEQRDVDALRVVEPGIDYEAMKKAFATVTGYVVRIDAKDIKVNGDKAVARCEVTYSPTPKPSGRIRPVTIVFHLRRSGDVWVIDRKDVK